MIRRRHILFVEGYDPQGASGYYRMFRSAQKRFLKLWPLQVSVGPLVVESDAFAYWTIETTGPNWQVATRYEFLRQEQLIATNISESMITQLPRAFGWILGDLWSGTMLRVLRTRWQFGVHHIYFQALLLVWVALAAAGGWLAGAAAARFAGLPSPTAIMVGAAIAVGVFAALRPLFERWHVVQITNHWPLLRRFGRGAPSCFDRPIHDGVERLIATVRANQCDEIVVFGHSGGGVLAPAIVEQALKRVPDLGRHGPSIVLMTLGSIMPAVAMHPSATRMREIVRRIATEPSVAWIDAQSRKDVLNFWDFDPVAGVGVDASPRQYNPVIWQVRFRDMVSPEFYRRLRHNFLRLHYQFISSGDRRTPYDYIMLTCGPMPVVQWAQRPQETLASFTQDGTLGQIAEAPTLSTAIR